MQQPSEITGALRRAHWGAGFHGGRLCSWCNVWGERGLVMGWGVHRRQRSPVVAAFHITNHTVIDLSMLSFLVVVCIGLCKHRKLWNMPVHKWLLRTVYFPAINHGINR